MRCPVNIATDVSFGPLGWHFFAYPALLPTYAFEMFATQMWTAGYLLSKNKLTTKVTHRRMPVVLDGHDQGPLIPDVTVPFPNAYYAVMWPMSQRKVLVSALKVQLDRSPAACTDIASGLPMISCGNPCSNPLVFSVTAFTNTVTVGLEAWDLLAGALTAVAQIGGDLLAYRLDLPESLGALRRELLAALFPLTRAALLAAAAKMVAAALSGFLVSAVRHRQSGGDVPYSVSLQPLDTPVLGGQAQYGWGSSDPTQDGWVLGGNAAGLQRQGNVSQPGPVRWEGASWGRPLPEPDPGGGGGQARGGGS